MQQGFKSEGFRSFMARMKLDVLSSASDWAFVMAEADALQSEDPTGCLRAALRRAASADGRRWELVVAELLRRGAEAGALADWPVAQRPSARKLA
jgi:hypothetical protein